MKRKRVIKKHRNPPRKPRFIKILENIEDVRVQGATDVAKAGIKAFFSKPKHMTDKQAIQRILKTRPTEPLLQNTLRFIQKSKNQKKAAQKFLTYIKKSHNKIAKTGAHLIKKDMNVFTHCHSSTVISILKLAKKKKNFVVYITEVEPLLQGRQTARELAKAKIKTIVFPDHAAEHALKKCDIFLFGADAISKKSLANKIGTSTLCRLAKYYNIPAYSCAISLKFTNKIKLETRPSKEVWDERYKKIHVINPAFDKINHKFITSIISEFGILPYGKFVKKARENLKKFK